VVGDSADRAPHTTNSEFSELAVQPPAILSTSVQIIVVLTSLWPSSVPDRAERAINRKSSKVRARAEHAISVIKRISGFAKVRYRGLAKNSNRLFVAAALANLYLVRGHLRKPADMCVRRRRQRRQ
jgi:hypothetical protein